MPLRIGGREGLTVKGALVHLKLYINYAVKVEEFEIVGVSGVMRVGQPN